MSASSTLSVAEPISGPSATGRNGLRWFELSLVLLVAFSGSFLNSLYVLRHGPASMPHISGLRWNASLIHEAVSLLLLGYVLARRSLRLADLGLKGSLREVGVGLLLVPMCYLTYALGNYCVHAIQYASSGSVTSAADVSALFGHPTVSALPFFLVNPFFEELIVRAYVITEVQSLTGSMNLAVVLSVALQTSYHLYYGWTGAIALSFLFLVLAIYYARTRRATPIVTAHAFFDLVGLLFLMRT